MYYSRFPSQLQYYQYSISHTCWVLSLICESCDATLSLMRFALTIVVYHCARQEQVDLEHLEEVLKLN